MQRILLTASTVVFALFSILPVDLTAQITAPGNAYKEYTSYPVSSENDPVYIFCSSKEGKEAVLQANTLMEGPKSWEWKKYNPQTRAFETYRAIESNSSKQSQITELENGCYRVNISANDKVETYTAWVFNNWNGGSAQITESNCDFFALKGTTEKASLVYYDLLTGQPVEISKSVNIEWHQGDDLISKIAAPRIYDPPTKNADYTFIVNDRFGCKYSVKVTYNSIVTKAVFKADPMSGEAPLEVKFSNNSQNGDPGSYEWFFFRDLDDIKQESAKTTLPIDSFMFVKPVKDDNPVLTYENSGTYMVKLVSKKSALHFKLDSVYTGICTDTVYLDGYIVADTSYFAVPNVFTPNGDGTNDNFVVKFWSMQSVKISLFNRWGRVVHVWESGNVRGFKNTWAETAWDGRIGGRMASPGVYYYVVEGVGRDGRKRWKHGNVYLFTDKR